MTEQNSARVRRGRQNANYTAISNRLIDHPSLSPEARIALIYLLSKPTDWQLQITDLRRVLGTADKPCGRNKTYEVLKELKSSSYVLAFEETHNGRFFRLTYYVFDEPLADPIGFVSELRREAAGFEPEVNSDQADPPCPEIRETVTKHLKTPCPEIRQTVAQPLPEIRDPEKRDLTKDRKKQITDLPPSPKLPSELAAKGGGEFQKLWDQWPAKDRPDFREAAKSIFEKLPSADRAIAIAQAPAYLRNCAQQKSKALMIPYLKNRTFDVLQDGPAIDADGRYRITPDRAEWSVWLASFGTESARKRVAANGYLLTKTRLPENQIDHRDSGS
jgi:hypothetical protein